MDGPGVLTTRHVKFKGKHLFVNLNGELKVEVIDEAGKVVATSVAVSGNHSEQLVELPGLAAHAGKRVQFRFHLASGSLYSFWVSSEPNGTSNGYVAAGGPDFTGVRDDRTLK